MNFELAGQIGTRRVMDDLAGDVSRSFTVARARGTRDHLARPARQVDTPYRARASDEPYKERARASERDSASA